LADQRVEQIVVELIELVEHRPKLEVHRNPVAVVAAVVVLVAVVVDSIHHSLQFVRNPGIVGNTVVELVVAVVVLVVDTVVEHMDCMVVVVDHVNFVVSSVVLELLVVVAAELVLQLLGPVGLRRLGEQRERD